MTSDWRLRARAVEQQDPLQASRQAIIQRQNEIGTNQFQNLPPEQSSQPGAWRSRAQPVQQTVQREPGLIGRNIESNIAEMQESADAFVAGEQGPIRTGAQQALSFASIPVDVATEAAGQLIPQNVKDFAGNVASTVGQLPSIGGGTIGERIPQELEMLSENVSPALKRDLRAGADALGLVGAATLPRAITSTARNIPRSMQIPDEPLTQVDIKRMATQSFDEAAELGATFTPNQVANKFDELLDDASPKAIAGKVLTSEDDTLIRHLDEFRGLRDAELSLDDIKRIDESIGNKITTSFVDTRTGQPNASGRKLMILQEDLREIVDDVPDTPGNDALVNARRLWRTQLMLKELDDIAERASMTQNVGQSLRTGYRNLFLNKKRIRGWPDEAKELLKKAATPGVGDDFLKLVSSRLPAIIMGGTGNIGGAATAHIIGAAGRGTDAAVGSLRGAQVQRSIIDDTIKNLRTVNRPGTNQIDDVGAALAAPTRTPRRRGN